MRGLLIVATAFSVWAGTAAGVSQAYRFHLLPGQSQQSYENKCSKSASLRALIAVPYHGRKYAPVAQFFRCYLYQGSEATGWKGIDVQATWHLPINGHTAVLGFPVSVHSVGLHTVELRIYACFASPCSGKNTYRKTFRQSGQQWSNVYDAGKSVPPAPKPPPTPPPASPFEYAGQTGQGYDISLTVTASAVTNITADVDAQCSDGETLPGQVVFDRIPVASGRFSATSTDGGETTQIDGQVSGSTMTGTLRFVSQTDAGTCDSGSVAFTAHKT